MQAAITELEARLRICEHNEPIVREEGDFIRADDYSHDAAEIRQALAVLNAATSGPIWPDPQ